jgi:hypothetical protein
MPDVKLLIEWLGDSLEELKKAGKAARRAKSRK